MAIRRNEVVFNSQPTPQPNNENKLAKFLASIGKFVQTPQGQQTTTNLLAGIPALFGNLDVASGIVNAGQQTYDRQMQEQKAREDQAFRALQMQLAQSQQNIDNQRKDDQFTYQQKKDAQNLAINQGQLNLGRDRLNWDKEKFDLGVGLKGTGTGTKKNENSNWQISSPEIANLIPPNLIRRDENGNVLVDRNNLMKHQVYTLNADKNGKISGEFVYTNTPEQAKKLSTATSESRELINLIDQAYVLRSKYSKESRLFGNKTVKAKYESLQSQMGLKIKNIYGLGVLSNTDIEVFIDNIVPNLNAFFDSTVFSKLETLRNTTIDMLNIHKNAYVYDPKKDPLNQFAIQSQSQSNFTPVVLPSGAKIIGVE